MTAIVMMMLDISIENLQLNSNLKSRNRRVVLRSSNNNISNSSSSKKLNSQKSKSPVMRKKVMMGIYLGGIRNECDKIGRF